MTCQCRGLHGGEVSGPSRTGEKSTQQNVDICRSSSPEGTKRHNEVVVNGVVSGL